MSDLTGLGKPLEKLIDVFARAAGVVFRPWTIRREAKAKADESLILARAEEIKKSIAEDSIEGRALRRMLLFESKRQENLESILEGSLPYLEDQPTEGQPEVDWVSRFVLECQDVSDDHLKDIWSRLLAGEMNRPGTFSRRSLGILQTMSTGNAKMFERIGSFVWHRGEVSYIPNLWHPDYTQTIHRVRYEEILELEGLGIINCGRSMTCHVDADCEVAYFDHRHRCRFDEESVEVRAFPLTTAGSELLDLVSRKEHKTFYKNVKRALKVKYGIILEEL